MSDFYKIHVKNAQILHIFKIKFRDFEQLSTTKKSRKVRRSQNLSTAKFLDILSIS